MTRGTQLESIGSGHIGDHVAPNIPGEVLRCDSLRIFSALPLSGFSFAADGGVYDAYIAAVLSGCSLGAMDLSSLAGLLVITRVYYFDVPRYAA